MVIIRQHLIEIVDSVSILFVALKDDGIIGTASINELHTSNPWISSVHVLPGHRGKGLGKLLMLSCEMVARARRRERILLWVRDDNPDARRLYERLGYIVTGGVNGNNIPMCRPLSYNRAKENSHD